MQPATFPFKGQEGRSEDSIVEDAILHEQLSYLVTHVCPACPHCAECTRLFRVKELLLAAFEEARPKLKAMHASMSCAEQRLSPAD